MIINYRWILKDLYGYSDKVLKKMTDNECEIKVSELQNSETVTCSTCNKEVSKGESWTLVGRDYDEPVHFCSDSCRMSFPFQKKL